LPTGNFYQISIAVVKPKIELLYFLDDFLDRLSDRLRVVFGQDVPRQTCRECGRRASEKSRDQSHLLASHAESHLPIIGTDRWPLRHVHEPASPLLPEVILPVRVAIVTIKWIELRTLTVV